MTLDIGSALERGYRRTTDRDGLLLVAVAYVVNLVDSALGSGRGRTLAPDGAPVDVRPGPLLEVSLLLDGVLGLLAGVATLLLGIAALRVFVEPERDTVPLETFTDDALWAGANLLVGGVVYAVVVGIGFVFFVIPGLFLLVSLVFWDVYVAVENDSFLAGFSRSWELTAGDRFELFGLGVAYVLLALLAGVVVGVPAFLLGPVGVFLAAGLTAALTVFASAVLASAYRQLTREATTPAEAGDP